MSSSYSPLTIDKDSKELLVRVASWFGRNVKYSPLFEEQLNEDNFSSGDNIQAKLRKNRQIFYQELIEQQRPQYDWGSQQKIKFQQCAALLKALEDKFIDEAYCGNGADCTCGKC